MSIWNRIVERRREKAKIGMKYNKLDKESLFVDSGGLRRGIINDVDDWKRYWCMRMPISETDSRVCVTPDGDINSCNGCRYFVKNYIRREKGNKEE